jgi:spore maturation protein CgeB
LKFAVLDTVYQGYVRHLYSDPSLRTKSWETQYNAAVAGGFPTLSAWVEPLRSRGHEVMDIWGDVMPLQMQWCIENDACHVPLQRTDALQLSDGASVGLERAPVTASHPLFVDIVMEQVRRFRPDVILSGYLHYFNSDFLRALKPYYRIAIGQHAAALPECDFSAYDAIVSSLPNQVEWFAQKGVASHFIKLAYDTRLNKHIQRRKPKLGMMFAGQITSEHARRAEALLAIGQQMELDIFGSGPWDPQMLKRSRIRMHPALWGVEMYQTMADSRVVFNCHIDAATRYANNLRLYEVSGAGALLLTDEKENMPDILTPGKECVTYRTVDECVDLAKYYLSHEPERAAIAAAGRKRIEREHTYFHRVDELLSVVQRCLS